MYYPKSKIKENLFTNGNELYFPSGKEYIGWYHELFDGKIYTDKTHLPSSLLLIKYPKSDLNIKINSDIIIYNSLQKNKDVLNIQNKKSPPPFYPSPTREDYLRGYFNRYFIKKKNDNIIIEISFKDYELFKSKSSIYDYNLYSFIEIPWKISGEVDDDKNIYGISTINKNMVMSKEKEMLGISKYLNNYIEFI